VNHPQEAFGCPPDDNSRLLLDYMSLIVWSVCSTADNQDHNVLRAPASRQGPRTFDLISENEFGLCRGFQKAPANNDLPNLRCRLK